MMPKSLYHPEHVCVQDRPRARRGRRGRKGLTQETPNKKIKIPPIRAQHRVAISTRGIIEHPDLDLAILRLQERRW